MTSRRVFLGSLAAAGAGTAAIVIPAHLVAQRRGALSAPVQREYERQMRAAMLRMKKGEAEGAYAAAALINLMAAQIEEGGLDQVLQATARKVGRNAAPDHAEMERAAKAMGADIFGLSTHVAVNPKYAGKTYEGLIRGERLSANLRQAARALELEAADWPVNGFLVKVQLQDNGDPNAYRDCPVCQSADAWYDTMEQICVVAAVAAAAGAPEAMAACTAAMATWMALESACQMSRLFGC